MKPNNERVFFALVAIAVSFAVAMLVTASEPAPQTGEDPYYGGELTIRVVDQEGQPVEGAFGSFEAIRWMDGTWKSVSNPKGILTDGDGMVRLEKGKKLLDYDDRSLVAWHEARKLVGIVPATQAKPDKQGVVTIQIANACHVTGVLTCEELTKLGHSIGWAIVFVHDGEWRPVGYATEEQKFEFWLPPGEYKLQAYGTKLHAVWHEFRIDSGQQEIIVPPIALPAVRSALLEGQPAPELRDIAAWKNSKPLKLEDLRGKYVLLNFWGHWCGPCVAHMPRMMDAYERYGRDELEIIAVHVGGKTNSVETPEQLDELLVEAREKYWGGRDLPFPVALSRYSQTQHNGTTRMARSVATADYGVVSYPTEILIDPQGNVIGDVKTALGAKDWVEMDKLIGRE